jgi:hypothetical protein
MGAARDSRPQKPFKMLLLRLPRRRVLHEHQPAGRHFLFKRRLVHAELRQDLPLYRSVGHQVAGRSPGTRPPARKDTANFARPLFVE